jgi:hypothetical protein
MTRCNEESWNFHTSIGNVGLRQFQEITSMMVMVKLTVVILKFETIQPFIESISKSSKPYNSKLDVLHVIRNVRTQN